MHSDGVVWELTGLAECFGSSNTAQFHNASDFLGCNYVTTTQSVNNFAQNKTLPRGEVRGRLSGHTPKAVRCLEGAPQSRPSVMGMIINRAKCVTGSASPVTSERWRIRRCTNLSTLCEERASFRFPHRHYIFLYLCFCRRL